MLETTKMIKTKSFRLATYQKGDLTSQKIAIVLPGRLDTKDYAHMRSHVDFLATKGYFAFSFDPPGTWESEGDISVYSMTNYFKAIQEIIALYKNKPTLLVGHSRGGGMALLAGTRINAVEKFVDIMGVASYKDVVIKKSWKEKGYITCIRDAPEGYDKKEKTFKLPVSFAEDAKQYDMRSDLKTCKKPKLFIAGKKDTIVDPQEVKDAYENSSKPKKFILLNSDHDYRKSKKLINQVNKLIEEFIS